MNTSNPKKAVVLVKKPLEHKQQQPQQQEQNSVIEFNKKNWAISHYKPAASWMETRTHGAAWWNQQTQESSELHAHGQLWTDERIRFATIGVCS